MSIVGKNSNSNLLSTVNVKFFLDRVRRYHSVTFRGAISKDARNISLSNLTEYRLLSFIRAFEVTRIRHSFWLVANCHDWNLVISGTNQNNRCSWTHASGCRYLSTKRPNKIYDDINMEKVQVSRSDWDRVHSLPKLKNSGLSLKSISRSHRFQEIITSLELADLRQIYWNFQMNF